MRLHNLKLVWLLLTCFSVIFMEAQENHSKQKTTQKLGDILLIVVPVTTLGTSFYIKDTKGAWQFAKGLIFTELVTYGLKLSINKSRPDLSNNNSFPSGHTATTFHSAGYIHRRYGFTYSIPAYLLAGFTAASRIDSNKHDILDILAGAAIGLGSNLIFTTEYQKKHFDLTFSGDKKSFLIGFTYKF